MSLKQFKNFRVHLGRPLLAVDFGQKTIGLATFTPGHDPYPLECGTITATHPDQREAELLEVIAREQIDCIIFGLPLLADGTEGKMAKQIREFADSITQKSGLPILFQDEYLSSRAARERILASSQYGLRTSLEKIDIESAKIILEDFIRASGV